MERMARERERERLTMEWLTAGSDPASIIDYDVTDVNRLFGCFAILSQCQKSEIHWKWLAKVNRLFCNCPKLTKKSIENAQNSRKISKNDQELFRNRPKMTENVQNWPKIYWKCPKTFRNIEKWPKLAAAAAAAAARWHHLTQPGANFYVHFFPHFQIYFWINKLITN